MRLEDHTEDDHREQERAYGEKTICPPIKLAMAAVKKRRAKSKESLLSIERKLSKKQQASAAKRMTQRSNKQSGISESCAGENRKNQPCTDNRNQRWTAHDYDLWRTQRIRIFIS